jgi:hypothetical protein
MKTRLRALAAATALLAAVPSEALVLVDQLYLAQPGVGIVGTISDFDRPLQVADGFAVAPSGPVALTRIDWTGRSSRGLNDFAEGPPLDSFRIRIFHDRGGEPGKNPFLDLDVSDLFTESPTAAAAQSLFSVTLPRRVVLTGQGFFLSIVADTPATENHWSWTWTNGPTMSYDRALDRDPWNLRGFRSYSFRLVGDAVRVPEPGTLMLFALGALALIPMRRRAPTPTARHSRA